MIVKLKNHKPRIVVIRVTKHQKRDDETQQEFLARQPDPEQYVRLLPMGTVDVSYELLEGNSTLLDMIRNSEISIAGEAETKASKAKKQKRSLDDMIADANMVAKTTKSVVGGGKAKPSKQTPTPESGDPEKDKFMANLPDDMNDLIDMADVEYDLEIKKKIGKTEVSIKRAKEAIWEKHQADQKA